MSQPLSPLTRRAVVSHTAELREKIMDANLTLFYVSDYARKHLEDLDAISGDPEPILNDISHARGVLIDLTEALHLRIRDAVSDYTVPLIGEEKGS